MIIKKTNNYKTNLPLISWPENRLLLLL